MTAVAQGTEREDEQDCGASVALLQVGLEATDSSAGRGSKDDASARKLVAVEAKAQAGAERASLEGSKLHLKSSATDVASARFDPDLLERPCIYEWMNESNTTLAEVCSDDPMNNIKSDKGNYIQFTRREDRLMYDAWRGAFQDCVEGQSYVRDIVSSFAERTSCFRKDNETLMMDDDSMYIPVKELIDNKAVVTDERDKIKCVGDSHMESQTELDESIALLRGLVAQWDSTSKEREREPVCREMLAAHTLHKYNFVGVLHSTRPAACNATAAFYDAALCQAAEKYLADFQSRDLFVRTGEGFKGRAAEGENERSERCKEEILDGREWNEMLSTNPGITVEDPKCTISTDIEVFPEPVLKVGVWHEDQANNIIADAYRQCGAPLVAGISATMPQYLASVAAGPTKKGQQFEKAASMKEVLTLMSMLELGGFHAVTGLTMSVNYYYKRLVVTPPFDSGAFEGESDGIIRCHDEVTNCCSNSTKDANGFYNHQVYTQMMEDWESQVAGLWSAERSASVHSQPALLLLLWLPICILTAGISESGL